MHTVLVIQPDESVGDIISQYVDQLGHMCVVVRDIPSAKEALKIFDFQVGVVDFVVGEKTALDILPLEFPSCFYGTIPVTQVVPFKMPSFSLAYPYGLFNWLNMMLTKRTL